MIENSFFPAPQFVRFVDGSAVEYFKALPARGQTAVNGDYRFRLQNFGGMVAKRVMTYHFSILPISYFDSATLTIFIRFLQHTGR